MKSLYCVWCAAQVHDPGCAVNPWNMHFSFFLFTALRSYSTLSDTVIYILYWLVSVLCGGCFSAATTFLQIGIFASFCKCQVLSLLSPRSHNKTLFGFSQFIKWEALLSPSIQPFFGTFIHFANLKWSFALCLNLVRLPSMAFKWLTHELKEREVSAHRINAHIVYFMSNFFNLEGQMWNLMTDYRQQLTWTELWF